MNGYLIVSLGLFIVVMLGIGWTRSYQIICAAILIVFEVGCGLKDS
jgi:hypothetical protein